MKIANADKLKKHFETVVDVHLFTVPTIQTIIDTFSSEVDEEDLISRSETIKKLEEMADDPWNVQVGSSKGLEDAADVLVNAPPVQIGGDKP